MRDLIVKAARSWLGTPFRHFQCCKGVGVDCAHFIIGVGKEVGIFSQNFSVPFYTSQEIFIAQRALLLNTIQGAQFNEKPINNMLYGDLLVFEINNVLCHVAIYEGHDLCVHAYNSRSIKEVQEFRLTNRWKTKYLKYCFSYPGVN